MRLGIDFGTSNTSAAMYDGKQLTFIPLDPANQEDPHVLASMLYISSKGEKLFGRRAMAEYFEQTAGQTIKYEQKTYGDVTMEFGDLTHVAKGFYLEEKESVGRLFQYLKKFLAADFRTNVFGSFYRPHELITMILRHVKTVAEQAAQQEIPSILLGRPVNFSTEDDKNRLAAKHLKSAALAAGFLDVEFEFEPVAAAYNYGLSAQASENVLIFDFGGGTFDVTVVNFEKGKSRILGLGGVPVGGSDFDRSIMYEKIAPYFGKGHYVDDDHCVSDATFTELLNWQTILNLNRNRRFLRTLDDWIFYADDPKPFKALKRLVKEHHGFAVFQEIETAKKRLSYEDEASVQYLVPEVFRNEGEIRIHEQIHRHEFESLLGRYTRQIMTTIDEAIRSAGLTTAQIDRVARVGGSSRIPFFHHLLVEKFGAERLLMQDEIKNVAAGLAVKAFQQQ